MKTLIITLIIASFLQSTILPIDLVLIILICRAYIKSGKSNLYLAFAFGLITSHLDLGIWGLQSLIFLIIIQAVQMLSKARFATNPLLILPISFIFLSLNGFINFLIGVQIFQLQKLLLEAFLSLPVLYMIRLWEERFIVQREIKLKV
ncbi:hypothetical protein KKE03_01650 [Patescibacteria group bacterium]|nr:hypothetical protein [Patescibacteria group bacterium]